jgi:hypothetical protein
VVTGALALTLALSGSAAGAGGTGTPVPFPADPSGLPAPGPTGAEIDAAAPYQAQAACVAAPLPGTVKLRDLVLDTYGRGYDGGTVRACTVGSTSEHKEGRAWDWMLDLDNTADRRAAGDFLAWVTTDDGTMARRLGIMYVIYNKRMWSTWSDGWESYEGSDPHTSHVHVSLGWNGARGLTSFWTGRTHAFDHGPCQVFRNSPAVVPGARARVQACPAPVSPARTLAHPLLWLGSAGDGVRAVQSALAVAPSGSFDAATRARVLTYQSRHDLPRTGAMDRATWAALLPDTAQSLHPEWTAAEAREWLREAGSPELHPGDTGRAVTALQAVLGLSVRDRTGYYGTRTARLADEVMSNGAKGSVITDTVWRMLG